MQFTFAYNDLLIYGRIGVIVDIPKVRSVKFDYGIVAKARHDIETRIREIGEEGNVGMEEMAQGLFKIALEELHYLVVVAVVFSVVHARNGETVLTFTRKDVK